MNRIAALLTLACIVVILVNEGIRIKYGFISNRHFVLFWAVWVLGLIGMLIALGLSLSVVL